MTAVLDVVDCPQCQWCAFYEFQTRTLTATTFCPRCGYREETRPLNHRKTKSGDVVYRMTKHRGMGAFMIKQRNDVSEIGALNHPLSAKTIAQFRRDLQHPHVDARRSFLSRWNPKLRQVEMVVGKFPRHLP
ncbi:MAG: hypothetical protein HZB51_22565 [Chloroflexi bacterium]|nr:hypothetical protein [Chloroflexota bacterium]